MQKGIVKWFHPTKGYGFITPLHSDAKDVFVHISTVQKAGLGMLSAGQTLAFETELRDGRLVVTTLSRA